MSLSLILRRLARVLRPATADADADDLRRRLRLADEDTRHWKARFARRTAAGDRHKKTIQEQKEHLVRAQAHADLRKRGELSHAVLQLVLPVRARQRPVLASDRPAAEQRERQLLEASSEYRVSIGDEETRQRCLQRVDILGVPWWVPRDERTGGRVEKLQRQGFPLRAVLQTREIALGGVMLDLGANVGRTSITRALLGDFRIVYAAEPEPVNYACLVQNVVEHGLRGFVLPDRVAIGAARGEAQLRHSAHVGGHRLLTDETRKPDRIETVTVQVWSLDAWMARLGVEPEAVSFVKVDTQGSEVNVLRGATALLARRHVAWQIEVDPGLLKHAGTTVMELCGLLSSHFTHFIDLGTSAIGPRTQSTRELGDALTYVGTVQSKTDLLVYNAVL